MPGDFAYIPPDTIHSYEFVSHSNKMLVLLLQEKLSRCMNSLKNLQAQVYVLILFKKGTSCSIGRLQLNMICFCRKGISV